ncbi:MAG TPA: FAD-dependent monooxygenase [Micromonosporaceae bacterium]|nr:FAD-dependent monooxygenase [Micromonosporaceae bacterium]
MTDRPVLIAGGGPVGLTAALLLARHGVPTVVLEAAPERDIVGSKSICVQRDVLDIYHRVGVADALTAEGVRWQTARTFYRNRELFTVRLPDHGGSAYPAFINVPQSSVERELERVVRATPLVDLRYGHRVHALSQDDESVTVRASTADGDVELNGSHLIAADGPRSAVRGVLSLDFDGHTYDDLFLIADIRADLPFPAERHFHFDPEWNPGRQVLVHPQPSRTWRIDWQVPGGFDLAEQQARGALDERIRRITVDVPYEVAWVTLYRFHQRMASRLLVGRVLLAGDAAHLMAPFGARGLNSGIADAENAAWKIAFHRRGWAGPDLLASYEHERMAAAAENLRVTGDTMRFLVPHTDAERAYRREVLDRAITDVDARALVNSGKLAEPYWYVDSPLTTGRPPAEFPTSPGANRPPVAGVLCPDVRLHSGRLRELFGPNFAVLSYGVDVAVPPDVPVDVYAIERLADDPTIATELHATPGWCAVVRPDGHFAAVLRSPTPTDVLCAIRRACGHGPR